MSEDGYRVLWEGKHDGPEDRRMMMHRGEFKKVRVVDIELPDDPKPLYFIPVMAEGWSERNQEWIANAGERQIIKQLLDENARLRTQNGRLAGATGELREHLSIRREAGEFIQKHGSTAINDCDYATCAYGLEAASTGFCPAEDSTGEAGCPAHLKICSACGGTGLEG